MHSSLRKLLNLGRNRVTYGRKLHPEAKIGDRGSAVKNHPKKDLTMKRFPLHLMGVVVCAVSIPSVPSQGQMSSNVIVVASGLQAPRGLKFGPDGDLYVAEAGTSGTNSNAGQCAQVIPPVGPYAGGSTSRISRIDHSGNRETVVSGLPSSLDALGDLQGVADLAFLDGDLYAVLGGAGCSHGDAVPNAIIRVNPKAGTWKIVANLSEFLQAHQARYENPADFEPDGTFYSLIAHDDRLYTVEPNHGQVFSVGRRGDIREEIDISLAENHIVPTAIAAKGDHFFVGNLDPFPITPEHSKILTLSRECPAHTGVPGLDTCSTSPALHIAGSCSGFTTVVGVDIGPDGLLYVLELSDAAGFPTPGAGKVVRLNSDGSIQDVATGLSVPTAMTFGSDGFLYVSNFGAAPAGAGQ